MYCYKFIVAHLTGVVGLLSAIVTRSTGRGVVSKANQHIAKDNSSENHHDLLHQI